MDIGKYSTDAMGHGGGTTRPHSQFEIDQYDSMQARKAAAMGGTPSPWRNVSHGMDADVNTGAMRASIKSLNGGTVPGYQPPTLSRATQSQGGANRSLMSPMSSPTPTSLNGTDRQAMAEAERSRATQSQGGRAVQDIGNQFTTTPSAPNLGDYSVPEDANPQSSWMTPPSGYTDLKGIGGRFAETGFQGPRNASGRGNDPRSLWRKAGDYIGDNPDVVVNALGQAIGGFAQSGLADRQVAVDERMMDLREQQAAYDQDKQRLREQFALSRRSKWA